MDVASTNAKLVWQKWLWYATSSKDIWCNVASVLVSLVHKRYPTNWWRPTVLRKACRVLIAIDGIVSKTPAAHW